MLTSYGDLMRIAKGRRRYGYPLWREGKISTITLALPDDITPAEAYAKDLQRRRDYFHKNSDPRLWANIRAELETVTDEALTTFAQADCASHYEAWELAGEIGLPRIERFKTLTLKSCKAPAHVLEGVREAVGVKAFRFAWRSNYDYSVNGGFCADGIYRAWLSAEYKNCGNGHYYLLISAERAIFCEDD